MTEEKVLSCHIFCSPVFNYTNGRASSLLIMQCKTRKSIERIPPLSDMWIWWTIVSFPEGVQCNYRNPICMIHPGECCSSRSSVRALWEFALLRTAAKLDIPSIYLKKDTSKWLWNSCIFMCGWYLCKYLVHSSELSNERANSSNLIFLLSPFFLPPFFVLIFPSFPSFPSPPLFISCILFPTYTHICISQTHTIPIMYYWVCTVCKVKSEKC